MTEMTAIDFRLANALARRKAQGVKYIGGFEGRPGHDTSLSETKAVLASVLEKAADGAIPSVPLSSFRNFDDFMAHLRAA